MLLRGIFMYDVRHCVCENRKSIDEEDSKKLRKPNLFFFNTNTQQHTNTNQEKFKKK